ncbi:MAG TPA: AraC family transcriptional regulator [Flavisolibacter sp.]|jgi:AraC-like DNA-binding protein|nr:AraC family transcriptional regulator [Flavisolibacter sp.]
MLLQLFQPWPELRHFIKRIVVTRFTLEGNCSRPLTHFPPQPEHCLYFYPLDKISSRIYGEKVFKDMPHSMMVGPQLKHVDLLMGKDMMVVMISFQPGGLHRLLRIPMHEIVDLPLDSSDIFGSEIKEVTEQLTSTKDIDKVVSIVQRFLLRKVNELKNLLPLDEVMEQMLQFNQILPVETLAKQACVSVRQLERQFKERIGYSPGLFNRLVRFSRAWILHEQSPELSWTSIAHIYGYADQMHMIRDFKDFTGTTPGRMHQQLKESSFHVQGVTFS